jgi:purine-nucleoside phosphorylase
MRITIWLLASTALLLAAAKDLGKPLTLKEPLAISKVLETPDTYAGKTVQVKGKITEVCTMMGCWMNLVETGTAKAIRIKVNDGEIVFPKEAIGKNAVAEGTFKKIQLTKEQAIARAKHEAEETGRKFDPEQVKGPVTIYQIQGTGARILE